MVYTFTLGLNILQSLILHLDQGHSVNHYLLQREASQIEVERYIDLRYKSESLGVCVVLGSLSSIIVVGSLLEPVISLAIGSQADNGTRYGAKDYTQA